MSIRPRDHVVQIKVSDRDWQLLGYEAVRRNRSGRGRVLLSLAEAGGLADLRKKGSTE